jgi:hypothetical protein
MPRSSFLIHQRSWRAYEDRNPRLFSAFDLIAVLAAFSGLAASTLIASPLHSPDGAGSDLKTLYASVWCFVHGGNAYTFGNMQHVFSANGVGPPHSWFGHAPVYPPMTLALLGPLGSIRMIPALYAFVLLSAVLAALSLLALLKYSNQNFDLGFVPRLIMVGLFAGGPLLAFALSVGNTSVPCAALAILAFTCRKWYPPWWCGLALALAIVLKPHLAAWMFLGMLVLPERVARTVALWAAVLVAAFTMVVSMTLAYTGTLGMQSIAYLSMLHAESSVGSSMSQASREVLPVEAQITSVSSVLGFWRSGGSLVLLAGWILLLLIAILVIWQTRLVRNESGASLAVGAWCALGLLVTYHRAADAIMLLVLLPWLMEKLRMSLRLWYAWAILAAYTALSIGPHIDMVMLWVRQAPANSVWSFLLLRQAGIADLLLVILLVVAMMHERDVYAMDRSSKEMARVPRLNKRLKPQVVSA